MLRKWPMSIRQDSQHAFENSSIQEALPSSEKKPNKESVQPRVSFQSTGQTSTCRWPNDMREAYRMITREISPMPKQIGRGGIVNVRSTCLIKFTPTAPTQRPSHSSPPPTIFPT